jgi:hypothetical protein
LPIRTLEPLREIDGVAGDERLAGGRIAGDDLAGVDADPHLESDAVLSLELGVELAEPIPHLVGGADGTQRIVLVGDRDAEHGHHRVADELLDRAAVMLEHGAHLREVPAHDGAQGFRVEPLAEGRRTGDVRKQDRDRLANLVRRLGLGERRAAGVAKARVFRVRLTAGAACSHNQV